MTDFAVTSTLDGPVAVVTIDRPARRNALSRAVKDALADAVRRCGADPSVRAVVLTGAGGCFVAGSDVVELAAMTPGQHAALATDAVFKVLRASPKPLVAAVEGFALGGGCELALCCDMIVAGQGARFGQPEIRLGIMPGGGGTQRLVRAVGKYRAMRMLLTGEPVTAPEALAMGLLSEVVADGAALARATALAHLVASMPPLAVKAIRETVAAGQDLPLEAALAMERMAFQLLFDSRDQKEGMAAFGEKRPPRFTGT